MSDNIYVRWWERLDGIRGRWEEADREKEVYDGCSMALLSLHEYVCKEKSCAPRLTLIERISTRKGSRKIRVLMRIFPTRKDPLCQKKRCQLYTTIKTPKPLQTKVRIIYPSSSTLELWKFSNLTFGRYLVGTTPILSTRSSLFMFRRCCLEHLRTVQFTDDFWHHLVKKHKTWHKEKSLFLWRRKKSNYKII